MIYVGVDPGTKYIGWCVMRDYSVKTTGTIKIKRLDNIIEDNRALVQQFVLAIKKAVKKDVKAGNSVDVVFCENNYFHDKDQVKMLLQIGMLAQAFQMGKWWLITTKEAIGLVDDEKLAGIIGKAKLKQHEQDAIRVCAAGQIMLKGEYDMGTIY